MTRERQAILDAVSRTRSHFDVDELAAILREHGHRVSRATIYRTLGVLVESGLAIRHIFGEAIARYESSFGQRHHDHLICVRCGEITEFENPEIEELQESVCREHGFELVRHTMQLFGVCPQCAGRGGGGARGGRG